MAANALNFTIVGVDEGSKVFVKFAKNVDKAADDVGKSSSKFGSAGKKAGTSLKDSLIGGIGLGLGAKLLELGLSAASNFFGSMNEEAREAQKVGAQTGAVLKSTGNAANVSAKEIGDLAGAISMKTGIDDEQIQSAENMLLTFTNVRNEMGKGNDVFTQATRLTTDLSVATGKDMVGSATMLGKALNDPIKGITALTRVGVTFTEAQKQQIKALAESGNVMGAQKIILAELTKEFGGSAEAQATAGDKIAVAFGNLAEQAGTAALPAIDSLANTLGAKVVPALSDGIETVGEMADIFNSLPPPVKIAAASLAGLTTAAAISIPAFSAVREKINEVTAAYAGLSRVGKVSALAFGAVGLAITGGIAILGAYGNAQRQAKEEVQSLKDTLDDTTAAITEQTRVQELQELRAKGMTDRARELGIEYNDLVSATLGNADAQAKVNAILQTYIALAESGGSMTGRATAEDLKHANAAKILQTEIGKGTAQLTAAQKAKLEEIAVAKGATGANKTLGDEHAAAAQKAQDQADALQELIDNLTKLTRGALDVSQAQINYQKAIDDATASVKENGRTLDISTEKGRANRDALNGIADATADLIESKAKQGATEGELQRIQDRGIIAFYKQAAAITKNKAEADRLTKAYFGIPGSRLTKLTADKKDADAKIKNLQAQLKKTHDKKTIAKINADIKAAQAKRRQIQREIDSIRNRNVVISIYRRTYYQEIHSSQSGDRRGNAGRQSPGKKSAAGGPAYAGTLYQVNENGVEGFIPAVNGTIVPVHKLSSIAAGEPSRLPRKMPRKPWQDGNVTIVIQNHGVLGSGREVEDWFVRAYSEARRKGRLS